MAENFKRHLFDPSFRGILHHAKTTHREYAPLEATTDHYEKYVISLNDFSLPHNQEIRHVQAWNLEEVLG